METNSIFEPGASCGIPSLWSMNICWSLGAQLIFLATVILSVAIVTIAMRNLLNLVRVGLTESKCQVIGDRIFVSQSLIVVLGGIWCVTMSKCLQYTVQNLLTPEPHGQAWQAMVYVNTVPQVVMAQILCALAALHAVVAIVFVIKRKQIRRNAQPATAPYSEPAARSPQG